MQDDLDERSNIRRSHSQRCQEDGLSEKEILNQGLQRAVLADIRLLGSTVNRDCKNFSPVEQNKPRE